MDGRRRSFLLPGGISLEITMIPAGSFLMGSPAGEYGVRVFDEARHRVTLTHDFYLGTYPVTQAQYESVMGRNPSAHRRGGLHPVECVSWHDAMKFCGELNRLLARELPDGFAFTLPTEAQWEYACRAGTETPLYNGLGLSGLEISPELDAICWYLGTTGEVEHKDVGTKEPNGFGLYDMLGNIHEWVWDNYGIYEDNAVDPWGPPHGREKVVRGGSWKSPAWRCRAARRGVDAPGYRLDGLGFRVALDRRV